MKWFASKDGEGAWPYPVSGWVKDLMFCPASHVDDPAAMLDGGWQPVSHVPPSHSFDPAPPAARRGCGDAREIAWSECDDCAADWPKDATCCPECGGDTRSVQYTAGIPDDALDAALQPAASGGKE